ncbi:NfeD family protein [Microvirga sp. W0021]|uniref:NfeD family protein n=1 Tax=Hohaiivirga grylli TaxID=3133970 RepID=A0ABV0BJI4_9HYPH
MIANLLESLGPWSWVVGGVLLILLELMIPGVFMVWLGLAAVATGVLDFALDMSWQFSALVFCVLSAVFVVLGRIVFQRNEPKDSDVGLLNHRARQLIGNTYILDEPIINGTGRVKVGDSSWLISGPDLPSGSKVRVIRTDGSRLFVEEA